MQKIGSVAYKLQLPEGSRIHPVFHVSLLKKKISDKYIPSPELPLTYNDGHFKVYPLQILDRRIIPMNNAAVAQVLSHWSNSSPEEATWEDYSFMESQFPNFDSNGDESTQGRGNVRNRSEELTSDIVCVEETISSLVNAATPGTNETLSIEEPSRQGELKKGISAIDLEKPSNGCDISVPGEI